VVQIWPGLIVCKQVTVCPGHIWTTLYNRNYLRKTNTAQLTVCGITMHLVPHDCYYILYFTLCNYIIVYNETMKEYSTVSTDEVNMKMVTFFTCSLSFSCVPSIPVWHYSFTNCYSQFFCIFCHCTLLSPYHTELAFPPLQLLISHQNKSSSLDLWCVHLPGKGDEHWLRGSCFITCAHKHGVLSSSTATANRTVATKLSRKWSLLHLKKCHSGTAIHALTSI
jgi:hypothetical protein